MQQQKRNNKHFPNHNLNVQFIANYQQKQQTKKHKK